MQGETSSVSWIIVGSYKSMEKEEIDEFFDRKEAKNMLQEYRLAYGTDWNLWIVKITN